MENVLRSYNRSSVGFLKGIMNVLGNLVCREF